MNAALHLVVSAVNSMAVVLVASYLVTRTPVFHEVLERRRSPRATLFLISVFSLLGIYGTMSGIHVFGAVCNTRYIGPVVAGLTGGPLVGTVTGLIAGAHRYLTGGSPVGGVPDFTRTASAASTVVAGIVAGLYHHFTTRRTGRFPGALQAAIVAAAVQVYHLGQVLLVCKPFEHAWALTRVGGAAMILANTLGTATFFFILVNLLRERATRRQRDLLRQQKQRIESELLVARDIQLSMVPKMLPKPPHWPECDLFASLQSAREVGGDFYDFFLDREGRLVFSVGDVSDKGVPASLFMAVTKTLLKGLHEPGLPPHQLLSRVNREIFGENDELMFVTVFCGVLDFSTGLLSYSNAGHNPPLLVHAGGAVERLPLPPGFVLGASPDPVYETRSVVLAPGDGLVAYTDGVTEAMNARREQYSERRLAETVRAASGASPEALVAAVARSVAEHAAGEPQSDDITILSFRYRGAAGAPRVEQSAGEQVA